MDIKEVLDSHQVAGGADSLARRVLNTAPKQAANVTLEEIEQGVTIERLESLNVPVYLYGGQVTIHGIFKDMPDSLVVAGYKSIMLNKNKSLGVKYVAIDGSKKQLLLDTSRLVKSERGKWVVYKSSKGFEAMKLFTDKQKAIDCYQSTPDNLYIGNKRIAALVYGGFIVILYIGAIYQHNVWKLISTLTGIESQSDADIVKSELEAKRKQDSIEFNKKVIERMDNEKRLLDSKAPLYNWIINPNSGIFYAMTIGFDDDIKYTKVEFKTRGKLLLRRSSPSTSTLEALINYNLNSGFHITNRKLDKQYKYILSVK